MAKSMMPTSIQLDGPFFKRDPRKTFRRNIRDLMAAVAEEGQADVQAQMRSGEGRRQPMRIVSPDRVSEHVIGRTSSLAGKPWAVTAVVSVNNSRLSKAQGTSLMAAAATIERRDHVFRRTTSRLRKAKKTVDLLKDISG